MGRSMIRKRRVLGIMTIRLVLFVLEKESFIYLLDKRAVISVQCSVDVCKGYEDLAFA